MEKKRRIKENGERKAKEKKGEKKIKEQGGIKIENEEKKTNPEKDFNLWLTRQLSHTCSCLVHLCAHISPPVGLRDPLVRCEDV